MKVGGYEQQKQPVPAEEDLPPLHFNREDRSLPTSQESYASTEYTVMTSMKLSDPIPMRTSTTNGKKRQREDADEEDLDLDSQPVSPRSRPISHTCMPNLDRVRPIALPRSRRKMSQREQVGLKESEMIDVGDFGEAGFFRPDAWGDDLGMDTM